MSESTQIDYNFGRVGVSNRVYINNEEYRQIDSIAGWENKNTKERPESANREKESDIVPGKSNYIRTCLEQNFGKNSINFRGNCYPYCFSGDTSITSVPSSGRFWPALPRFDKDGKPSANGIRVGMQKYVCPATSGAVWPNGFHTLKQLTSNSAWPVRPSNGNGAALDYSPSKPFFTRIRIPLVDLKWKHYTASGSYRTLNILEDESVETSSDNRTNGEILELTRVRGFINLINPDGINATTNSSGSYKWPHNFNQIYYRVTDDYYGGDDDTPLITVMNSQCAGNAQVGGLTTSNQNIFSGSEVPFDVPVLLNQKYLIFDIYTDVCDRADLVLAASTKWWQMTWSFEGCMFRRKSDTGDLPTFHIEYNAALTPVPIAIEYWPYEAYACIWDIKHELSTQNVSVALYDMSSGKPVLVGADVSVLDVDRVRVVIKSNYRIPAARFKVFIVGGNKY